jgi:hypothetical protein
MKIKCQPDCEYYSNHTKTCDHTLLMYQSRGCPVDACTKYKQRTTQRAWNTSNPLPQFADCGHEISAGESSSLCPECMGEVCDGMTVEEKMAYIGFMRGVEGFYNESA